MSNIVVGKKMTRNVGKMAKLIDCAFRFETEFSLVSNTYYSFFFNNFLITDTSTGAGKDVEHTKSKKFYQDSPITPKDATKYKQASSSNKKPLAPGFSMTSRPSSSESKHDKLMRVKEAVMTAIEKTEAILASITESSSMSTSESKITTLIDLSLGGNFTEAACMDMGFPRKRCIEAVEANLRY